MNASLVWDGTDEVRIPESMGTPREDQMLGTAGERLGEVCGRICYDSLGIGRSSASFHEHISQVKHFSVYEHYMRTFQIRYDKMSLPTTESNVLLCLINRPGIWVEDSFTNLRITFNPRVLLDWDSLKQVHEGLNLCNSALHFGLRRAFLTPFCPAIEATLPEIKGNPLLVFEPVEPETEDEKWISLYMQGSRGFSHEQVRHGDFSAISQRSTRYVDESESDWVEHPLITEYLSDTYLDETAIPLCDKEVIEAARRAYQVTVTELEPYLIDHKKTDKVTARKQARGAARGYLGNALSTELIFSASVTQWKRQLKQRLNAAADAEIRQIYVPVLNALKQSRYANCFENYSTKPSPDGIGLVLE